MNASNKIHNTRPILGSEIAQALAKPENIPEKFNDLLYQMHQIERRGYINQLEDNLGITFQIYQGRIYGSESNELSSTFFPYEIVTMEKIFQQLPKHEKELDPAVVFRKILKKKDKTEMELIFCVAILRPTLERIFINISDVKDRRNHSKVSKKVANIIDAPDINGRFSLRRCGNVFEHGFFKHFPEYKELQEFSKFFNNDKLLLPEILDKNSLIDNFGNIFPRIRSVLWAFDKQKLSPRISTDSISNGLSRDFNRAWEYASQNQEQQNIYFSLIDSGKIIERGTFLGSEEQTVCTAYCSVNFRETLLQSLDEYFLRNDIKACYRFGIISSSLNPDTAKNNFEIRFFHQLTIKQRGDIGEIMKHFIRGSVLLHEPADVNISFRSHIEIYRGHMNYFIKELQEELLSKKSLPLSPESKNIGQIFYEAIVDKSILPLVSKVNGKRSTDIVMDWEVFYCFKAAFKLLDLSFEYDEEKGLKLLNLP